MPELRARPLIKHGRVSVFVSFGLFDVIISEGEAFGGKVAKNQQMP